MPNLEDLQKQLYIPEKPSLPPVEQTPVQPEPPIEPPKMPEDIEPSPFVWKKIWIGFGIFALLSIIVGTFIFFRGFYAFRKDRIDLTLSGPEEIVAGDTAIWKLQINNKNETEIREGELIFQYPDFSKPVLKAGEADEFKLSTGKQTISVPQLAPGASFEREFKAVIFGGENFEKKAQVVFKFKPSSGNISFESISTKSIKITSFPISMSFDISKETVSGEEIEAVLHIKNDSDSKFENLRVRIEYPSGFDPKMSSEKLYEFNNIWRIDEIQPKESKDLSVVGDINGLSGEAKIFKSFVEGQEGSSWRIYKETNSEMKLIAPPIALYLNTEPPSESLSQDQSVFYKIIWQNNVDIPLSNLTLKLKLDGDAFDFAQSDFAKGTFNSATKTVTWNQNNLPDLFGIQPMERGELTLRIRIKTGLPAGTIAGATATIESTTKPEGLSVSKISSSQSLNLEVK
jgi:hypothetical protein